MPFVRESVEDSLQWFAAVHRSAVGIEAKMLVLHLEGIIHASHHDGAAVVRVGRSAKDPPGNSISFPTTAEGWSDATIRGGTQQL